MTGGTSTCNTDCRCIAYYMLCSSGQYLPDTTRDKPPSVVEGVYAQLQVCVRRVQTRGRPLGWRRPSAAAPVWGQGSGPRGIPR